MSSMSHSESTTASVAVPAASSRCLMRGTFNCKQGESLLEPRNESTSTHKWSLQRHVSLWFDHGESERIWGKDESTENRGAARKGNIPVFSYSASSEGRSGGGCRSVAVRTGSGLARVHAHGHKYIHRDANVAERMHTTRDGSSTHSKCPITSRCTISSESAPKHANRRCGAHSTRNPHQSAHSIANPLQAGLHDRASS
ncbi:hypothetical protein B0H17DRAFT_1128394 [Mycena rosella]|uniref:Uncharacterized protein n=1 Tax=Mycena rosella TaxID=1033263 RepID=A0AAD7GPG0_MYCRO|nr:hypothetical protein B0H17DRAFT_1128394 [Mycena rosella]